ncbi:MAG: hypothetical protein FJ390_02115 [Verrucomicrobia bacterium]|nr:hypothetical protein [Verrucomicrobiota bacterium]
MEFSRTNATEAGFSRLQRGTSVRGDREIKPDALIQFSKVAQSSPEADRIIMSEDGLDVTVAPKPFFGVSLSLILGTSEKELNQNKAILAGFQEALIKRYGTRVTDFAFPDLNQRLLHGSKLDSKTIQRVLNDAQLFEAIFLNDNLREAMTQAVKTDIEADAACMEFEKTSTEHDTLYNAAQLANKKKEAAAAKVTNHIKEKLGLSDLPPNDPKLHELEELQALWRAASLEDPENPNEDLGIFEAAAKETDPLKGDRFVLNREKTRLTSAPRPVQGWTGAAVQWMAGRTKTSVEENRRTVEVFRQRLTRKYGHTISSFAFSSALSRHERGSRLNSETIQRTLAKAKQVSELLHDPSLKSLTDQWTSSVQEAETAEASYREIKIARDEIAREKDTKLSAAELARTEADNHILEYLTTNALEKNITIAQSARLQHMWPDEARARYKKAQAETRVQPSAPPAPGSMLQRDLSDPAARSATNPSYRVNDHAGNSMFGNLGSTLGAAAYRAADQLGDYFELKGEPNVTRVNQPVPMATEVYVIPEKDNGSL